MAVFAVVASDNPQAIADNIKRFIVEQDYHQVDEHTWFVSAPEKIVTPKELSDHLQITAGEAGRVIVFLISSYYGYHSRNAWDWLTVKGV